MHMQDGVGRQGYKVLAWVFAAIGVIGLGAGWYAFANALFPFQWLGFGLAAAGLAALVIVNLTVLGQTPPMEAGTADAGKPAATPAPVPTNADKPAETPVQRIRPKTMVRLGPPVPRRVQEARAAEAKQAQGPAKDAAAKETPKKGEANPAPKADPGAKADPGPNMEYPDAKPAAKAAPTELVLPPGFEQEDASGGAWPERRPASGVRLGDMQNRAAQQLSVAPPVVMAKIWYPQSGMPRGWNKGQCGDCGTTLMAPPERPLRLRCPHCDKVTDMPAKE